MIRIVGARPSVFSGFSFASRWKFLTYILETGSYIEFLLFHTFFLIALSPSIMIDASDVDLMSPVSDQVLNYFEDTLFVSYFMRFLFLLWSTGN